MAQVWNKWCSVVHAIGVRVSLSTEVMGIVKECGSDKEEVLWVEG